MAGNWISSRGRCFLEMRHSGPAQWCSLSMSICGLWFLDTSVDSFEMVERKKHHKPKLPLSRSLMSPLVLIEDLFLVCYLSEVTRFTYFKQQSPHLNHLAFIQSFVYLSQSLNMKSCLLICCWPLFKWGKGNFRFEHLKPCRIFLLQMTAINRSGQNLRCKRNFLNETHCHFFWMIWQ